MNLEKSKYAPHNYKGNISEIPLWTIIDYISFTCILYVENGKSNSTGALYYKDGKLIGARVNNDYSISKANNILKWKTGNFSYQKWNKDFFIDINQMKDVFYFIEIANLNVSLNFPKENVISNIYFSNGKIVKINPCQEDVALTFINILKIKTGKVNIELISEQSGDLDLYYSELVNPTAKSKKERTKKPTGAGIKTKKTGNINIEIIKQTFQDLNNSTDGSFIDGVVYDITNENNVYSSKKGGKHEFLFAEFYKVMKNSNFQKTQNYFLIDLQDGYLVFVLIFKKYHLGFIFKDIKIGYLLNIIKPIIISDYNKAIK